MGKIRKPNIPQRSFEHRAKLVAQELKRAPLVGHLYSYGELSDDRDLILAIGNAAEIEGTIARRSEKLVAHIDRFNVASGLQRQGIGERLLRAFTAEAKQLGVVQLWSDSITPMALRLRAKVFGEANLHFYDGDHIEKGFFPITVEQAIQCDDRLLEAEATRGEESQLGYIGVFVDLDVIDTSTWELPLTAHTVVGEPCTEEMLVD